MQQLTGQVLKCSAAIRSRPSGAPTTPSTAHSACQESTHARRDQTYTFDPNSLSALISYESGSKKTETQTLTASLPTITIRQGIRTLYDITQEGIRKIKDRLYRTVDIAKSLLDWYKDCMEMAKTIGFLTLAVTIATAIIGGSQLEIFKPIGGKGTMTGRELGQTVSAVGMVGTSFMNAWMNYCKLVSEMYQLDMKIQEIEIQMIQMEMCMEQNQHMLDIGKCDGREESCFNQMVSCVKFSEIRNSMNDINKIMDDSATDSKKMGNAFDDLGKAVDTIGVVFGGAAGKYATIQMRCNDRTLNTKDDFCCNVYSGLSGSPPECKSKTQLKLIIVSKGDCNVIITEQCNENSQNCVYFEQGGWSKEVDLLSPPKTLTFKFYCYDSVDRYSRDSSSNRQNYEIKRDGTTLTYEIKLQKNIDSSSKCDCSEYVK